MLQRSIHGRLSILLVYVFFSCLSSTALLPATRGTRSQLGKSKHDVSSLWKIHCKSKQDFAEDDLITQETTTTATSKSLTRQFFLSSVCSRSVSVIAATTGVSVPQIATAMVTTDFISNNGDRTMTTAQSIANSGPSARVLTMTLRSLPVSGCWAAPVTVSRTLESDDGNINNDDFYTYLAVVDTGSPFLTAPIYAFPQTKKINFKQSVFSRLSTSFRNTDKSESDFSYEQYGDTVGSVNWRMAPYLTLIGNGEVDTVRSDDSVAADEDNILKTEVEPVIIQDQTDFVLGIPSEEVVEETGGIFLGLMTVDASRPTPLQQLGYDAFAMRFRENDIDRPNQKKGKPKKKETIDPNSPATLVLWDGKKQSGSRDMENSAVTSSLIDRFDPYSMKLFSFTPYGPNIHHYGVLCDRFECSWGRNDDFDVVAFDCDMGSGINSCTSARESTSGISLSRPLVAVFDTGLSGCIFSDTLWEEIRLERRRQRQRGSVGSKNRSVDANDKDHRDIRNDGSGLNELDSEEPSGCTVWLPTIGSIRTTSLNEQSSSKASPSPPSIVKLSSISNYWRFQSYRLPWWYADSNVAKVEDTEKFPHVVVLGSTFWRNPDVLELAVDTTSERGKIRTMAHR